MMVTRQSIISLLVRKNINNLYSRWQNSMLFIRTIITDLLLSGASYPLHPISETFNPSPLPDDLFSGKPKMGKKARFDGFATRISDDLLIATLFNCWNIKF